MAHVIIGWDIGGERAVELPVDSPGEILIARAAPDLLTPSVPATSTLRIWGMHPLLKVTVDFHKRLRAGVLPSAALAASQLEATIQAWPITKTSNAMEPFRRGNHPLPPSIFLAGGVLDDGCEVTTGVQGVEFEIVASTLGATDHELVASIQVMQTSAIGCIELAEKLISVIQVDKPSGVITFEPAGG